MKISVLAIVFIPGTAAFTPATKTSVAKIHLNAGAVSSFPVPSKPIFDPLGLYPENSPERYEGLIQPLESTLDDSKEVFDPLRLYSDQSQVSSGIDMSSSLPFLPRPALLDGTLPGDRGFDPFNFASDANALQWQRKAEMKHARLAMLASFGWPIAELLHGNIAKAFDLPLSLASDGRVPSVLNDGLSHAPFPLFWIGVIAAAAAVEIAEVTLENISSKLNPGDMGFDPFNLFGKTEKQQHFMEEAELFNGRLGMLAIVSFAMQEWFLNSAVVNQIPIFFKPINVALEQMMSG